MVGAIAQQALFHAAPLCLVYLAARLLAWAIIKCERRIRTTPTTVFSVAGSAKYAFHLHIPATEKREFVRSLRENIGRRFEMNPSTIGLYCVASAHLMADPYTLAYYLPDKGVPMIVLVITDTPIALTYASVAS